MNYMTSGKNMRITLDGDISNGKVEVTDNQDSHLPDSLKGTFTKLLVLKNIVIAFGIDDFEFFASTINDEVNNGFYIKTEEDLEPIEDRIKATIEKYLRPNIEADGGTITFNKFDSDTGIAYVTLGGACSGCSASSQTLEYAVNNVLISFVPEIVEVQGDFDQPVFDDGLEL